MLNCHIKSLYLCVKGMKRAIRFYENFFEKEVTIKDEIYLILEPDTKAGIISYEANRQLLIC